MCGAVIKKGVSWSTIIFGFIFSIIGVVLLSKEDLVGVGATLLIFGILLLLMPMCMVRYWTELQTLTDPTDPAGPAAGYVSFYLRTFNKPDDDFIMLYVYGSLLNNMGGYHALAHLIEDSLVGQVEPREMTAIQIRPDNLPGAPNAPKEQVPAQQTINAGYGNALYMLQQTTGLLGDDVSPLSKLGTTCLKNTVRAVFCENLIVVSNEQRILCCALTR